MAGLWHEQRPLPSGVTKQSGVGREMGVAGFEEYLEIEPVAEPA